MLLRMGEIIDRNMMSWLKFSFLRSKVHFHSYVLRYISIHLHFYRSSKFRPALSSAARTYPYLSWFISRSRLSIQNKQYTEGICKQARLHRKLSALMRLSFLVAWINRLSGSHVRYIRTGKTSHMRVITPPPPVKTGLQCNLIHFGNSPLEFLVQCS